ncbi:hypothetical protein SLV14_006445 [Streptomyces sp. Je 1-4]|uniref:hypothetical protein n=1 Tax=Streptomyces TaxID=1883 RepID=UPI00140EC8E5|nr:MULTISPECIES: hypothetical protein [unclassified Streptomyces]QIK09756.1 hypothetical protein G7Z12_30530 [Streptomyces sp. ID38640]UYB43471.1 hypothetical protein SLV14_006445 [Streptomyces sp. Je 1-4]UZQ39851.1 hypothetical protein SLV14N_006445 [Streptomyces sp. Je 1-4] [Streptomyces sp. Je 1-4 4N24]UZQ47268.1 hypothetical protein SLV14NA_006445 [Streptomyces sp. Je 1-4] [Streptomyces sp. Je 1-4 4N24_ara]
MISGDATPLPGWRGGDGNAAYLDKTLRHEPVELGLNERVSGKTILGMIGRAVIAAAVAAAVPSFISAVLLSQSTPAVDASDGWDGTRHKARKAVSATFLDAGASTWALVAFGAALAAFVLILFLSRLPEPVAEWRVLLADRPDRASVVYERIKNSLTSRQYPITPEAFGHRIALHHKPYVAYVSVFNYGTSLYLGWTMWRARRGAALLRKYVAELARSFKGDGGIERQMLRSEGATVMREAVHLACREGLMVAVEVGATGHGTDAGGGSRPAPPPPAVPPPLAAPPGAAPGPALPGQPRPPAGRGREGAADG